MPLSCFASDVCMDVRITWTTLPIQQETLQVPGPAARLYHAVHQVPRI